LEELGEAISRGLKEDVVGSLKEAQIINGVDGLESFDLHFKKLANVDVVVCDEFLGRGVTVEHDGDEELPIGGVSEIGELPSLPMEFEVVPAVLISGREGGLADGLPCAVVEMVVTYAFVVFLQKFESPR
jgi:hypothetical protein